VLAGPRAWLRVPVAASAASMGFTFIETVQPDGNQLDCCLGKYGICIRARAGTRISLAAIRSIDRGHMLRWS
jgi:hypothetical protein